MSDGCNLPILLATFIELMSMILGESLESQETQLVPGDSVLNLLEFCCLKQSLKSFPIGIAILVREYLTFLHILPA